MDETTLGAMTDRIVDELHPEEIFLFGSRAVGADHADSDIDLLVILPDSEETRRYRRRLTGRLYRRLASFPVSKDILVYTRSEVERWRDVPGHVISTSLRNGRRLYTQPQPDTQKG